VLGDNDRAVRLANTLYQRGYYCSAMFFPIVAKGQAGVRLMLRGDMTSAMTEQFASVLDESLS
jgi:7-keto-8-aminopelargonate synthetase-like enzyme